MEELIKFKKELLAEKEKLITENADKMEIHQVMLDLVKLERCEEFVEKYGEEIRIPCTNDFTLIIEPNLYKRNVKVSGYFVLNSGMHNFLYDHVYDSHSDLGEWFDELCQNLLFGIQDAPVLTQNINDVERTVEYYKGEKAKKLYTIIENYLKFLIEANPKSVNDFDYY